MLYAIRVENPDGRREWWVFGRADTVTGRPRLRLGKVTAAFRGLHEQQAPDPVRLSGVSSPTAARMRIEGMRQEKSNWS